MAANADPATIERQMQESLADEVTLVPEGLHAFRVITPFVLPDGDGLAIVLKRVASRRWVLADEGHTFMRLTYSIEDRDLRAGTRGQVISDTISMHGLEEADGELTLEVPDGRFGAALFEFSQALLRLHDVRILSRERVRSAFIEDFQALMTSSFPSDRRTFNWHDPERDKEHNYPVDCRVEGDDFEVMVFALPGDARVRDATITILTLEKWGRVFRSVGLYEDMASLGRRPVAQLSDVCDKQFSALDANREKIAQYITSLAGIPAT